MEQRYQRGILLPASGMHSDEDSPFLWKPTPDALVRIVATAIRYNTHIQNSLSPAILALGGIMDGPTAPARSTNLEDYLGEYFSLNTYQIYTEQESIDTDGNAEQAKHMIETNTSLAGIEDELDLVTNDYHMQRALEAFYRNDLRPSPISAENIVNHPYAKNYLERLPKEDAEMAEEFLRTGPKSENLANTLIHYAARNPIGRYAMRKMRERQIAKNG
ncbi:YdcF family protein [archaeon]|nr:YdcF family protein [archaeon]